MLNRLNLLRSNSQCFKCCEFPQIHFNLEHVGYSISQRNIHYFFNEIKPKDVNQVNQFNAQAITRTHNLHQALLQKQVILIKKIQ
jgi:hypothetical protein